MTTKTYGYDRNGNVSECTAQERNRGKGRCNHYGHFNTDNKQELIEKTEAIQAELNNDVNAGMIAHNVSKTGSAEREINLSTAEDYIISYLENCGEDDGDWDTYRAAKDLLDICIINGYDNYEQVDPDEFTELLKENAWKENIS